MKKNIEKVCMLGIGGISMSALAQMLKHKGITVCGSDANCTSKEIEKLKNLGIRIFDESKVDISKDCDIVVKSSAIKNNLQTEFAKKNKIPVIERSKLLGTFSKEHKNTVSISGSHGKSTTTAMISTILINAGLDPSVHIGANLDKISGNVRCGKSEVFITEACEYCDSFLDLHSFVSVVLNIQPDHLDYFKNIKNIEKSFQKFALNTKKSGYLIVSGDDKRTKTLYSHCKTIYFGKSSSNNYYYKNEFEYRDGYYAFNAFENKKCLGKIFLSVPGKHNIKNALASLAVARIFGVDFSTIAHSLLEFSGVERRFQHIETKMETEIIHDYAHHPTEIRVAIETAKKMTNGKVICIFQPHTFTRTKSFFVRFAKSLSKADECILFPIYPAREKPIKGISSDTLSNKIIDFGTKSLCIDNLNSIFEYVKTNAKKDDLVLILGAGDIVDLCNYFNKSLDIKNY